MKKIIALVIALLLGLVFMLNSCENTNIVASMSVEDMWAKYEKSLSADERAQTQKLDKVTLNDIYGLSNIELSEYVAYIPATTDNSYEAIIVQVLSGQREYTISKMLERQEHLEKAWENISEEQLEYIQNYTLVQRGNYILFTIGPNSKDIVKVFESAF